MRNQIGFEFFPGWRPLRQGGVTARAFRLLRSSRNSRGAATRTSSTKTAGVALGRQIFQLASRLQSFR